MKILNLILALGFLFIATSCSSKSDESSASSTPVTKPYCFKIGFDSLSVPPPSEGVQKVIKNCEVTAFPHYSVITWEDKTMVVENNRLFFRRDIGHGKNIKYGSLADKFVPNGTVTM